MSLRRWLDRSRMMVRTYGPLRGTVGATRALWSGVAHRLSGLGTDGGGTNVYECDWDLLVVLDACRADALQAVAAEYEFLPAEVPSVRSVGPSSDPWIERTFDTAHERTVARTAYLSANPHTEGFHDGRYPVDAGAFARLDNVFDWGFDEEHGTVPPGVLTDHAVAFLRDESPDRTILHYMQPHTPYRGLDMDGIRQSSTGTFRETVWDLILSEKLTRDRAWELYLDNLRWALDEVAVLLRSVNADRVVITADHGECFGEFGAYGHSPSGGFDALLSVPWVETTATDDESYEPSLDEARGPSVDVQEQLEHLGYV